MSRNRGDNHNLLKKPERPKRPRHPSDDVHQPKKSLPRPHKRKGGA